MCVCACFLALIEATTSRRARYKSHSMQIVHEKSSYFLIEFSQKVSHRSHLFQSNEMSHTDVATLFRWQGTNDTLRRDRTYCYYCFYFCSLIVCCTTYFALSFCRIVVRESISYVDAMLHKNLLLVVSGRFPLVSVSASWLSGESISDQVCIFE